MTTISATELALSVKFNRPVRNAPMTLFAVMRNEKYFLPSFLEHYRKLGVEQFVIVDDASDDGTGDYLAQQPDCCSGSTRFRFGERIMIPDPDYGGLSGRAGPILKRVVPDHYLRGQYVIIADADEFLLLPEKIPHLPALVEMMVIRGWKSVAASLIDFYPAMFAELEDTVAPADVSELFSKFSHFDAAPFITLTQGKQPQKAGRTASERLFRACGIRDVPPVLGFLPQWLTGVLPFRTPGAAWFKTPVIRYDGGTFMVASHAANVPPPPDILLAMAHFKFNGDTYRKIQSALLLKSHARKGQKYSHYQRMLGIMESRKMNFICPQSVKYSSPEQLVAAGLMIVPR